MALNEVRVMRGRYFRLIVVLTSLTVVGQPATWGYRRSERPANSSVGFQLYRDYLIVVQGTVGPVKGLNFLLDTGANTTVLSPQLARKLRLDTAATGVAVLGGNVQGEIATAPSLQLGPVRRDNVRVVIKDLSFIQDALPFRIDAIVGLDMLGQSAFVIDYSSREIRFGPVPSMPDSIPLELKDGLVFVDAVVNHTTLRLLLDTAASSLTIFDELPASNSGLKGSDHPSPNPPKRIGDFDHRRAGQMSLRLGEVEFGYEPVFVVPNLRDAGHDFDGMLSPVTLGITRVAVDLNQRTLAFVRDH
jgi:Aspartyl protease